MEEEKVYDYDYFIIGGGSGGLSAAAKAVKFNAKIAVADFVKSSPQGTTWGLGGTCVNVGCIPKKLMHYASTLGEYHELSKDAGFTSVQEKNAHDWSKMVKNITTYIKMLNHGAKTDLSKKKTKYYNSLAELQDKHTILLTDKKNKQITVTAKYILIAVGGRPTTLEDIPDAPKLCITSDDLFKLEKPPGKTLIVGASYIALECAGFLAGLGYDVTVMVRSILLRGFDQEFADEIGQYMERHGVKFIKKAQPTDIKVEEGDRRRVTYTQKMIIDGDLKIKEGEDVYDTVLLAIGRQADTSKLGLDKAGVEINKSGKIICNDADQTNVDNIFAIGDVAQDRPELTPAAIMAGKFLTERLFGESQQKMDYDKIATTVFTPIEYGTIGYSEEDAKKKFGEDNIVLYKQKFRALEWVFSNVHDDDYCLSKLICNKADNEKVVGFHYMGPHAGEVTQGFGVAFKSGATKKDFDDTIGIHPTTAENFTTNYTQFTGELDFAGC